MHIRTTWWGGWCNQIPTVRLTIPSPVTLRNIHFFLQQDSPFGGDPRTAELIFDPRTAHLDPVAPVEFDLADDDDQNSG